MASCKALAVAAAVALVATATSCTLVDPLDDLTGGARPGEDAAAGSRDVDATDARPSDASTDAAAAVDGLAGCLGPLETEPNDVRASASAFAEGLNCGSIDGADVDVFTFHTDQPLNVTIVLESAEPIALSVEATGQPKLSAGPGTPLTFALAGPTDAWATVTRGSSGAASAPYRLRRTAF